MVILMLGDALKTQVTEWTETWNEKRPTGARGAASSNTSSSQLTATHIARTGDPAAPAAGGTANADTAAEHPLGCGKCSMARLRETQSGSGRTTKGTFPRKARTRSASS